jgi:hypothetical protein
LSAPLLSTLLSFFSSPSVLVCSVVRVRGPCVDNSLTLNKGDKAQFVITLFVLSSFCARIRCGRTSNPEPCHAPLNELKAASYPWQSYESGVFSCGQYGNVDHAIQLVGYSALLVLVTPLILAAGLCHPAGWAQYLVLTKILHSSHRGFTVGIHGVVWVEA